MDVDLDEEQVEQLANLLEEPLNEEKQEAREERMAAAKARLRRDGKALLGIVAKKAKLKK